MKRFASMFVVFSLIFTFGCTGAKAQAESSKDEYLTEILLVNQGLQHSFNKVRRIMEDEGGGNHEFWTEVAIIAGRLKQADEMFDLITPPKDFEGFHSRYAYAIEGYGKAAEHFRKGVLLRSSGQLQLGLVDFKQGNNRMSDMAERINEMK